MYLDISRVRRLIKCPFSDPRNRALAVAERAERRERAMKTLDVPSGYSGSPADVSDNGEDDDGLMAIWRKFGLTVDYAAITAVRNWSAQNAQAPSPTGVGKGAVFPSG
jgi:hypothetical protein